MDLSVRQQTLGVSGRAERVPEVLLRFRESRAVVRVDLCTARPHIFQATATVTAVSVRPPSSGALLVTCQSSSSSAILLKSRYQRKGFAVTLVLS